MIIIKFAYYGSIIITCYKCIDAVIIYRIWKHKKIVKNGRKMYRIVNFPFIFINKIFNDTKTSNVHQPVVKNSVKP